MKQIRWRHTLLETRDWATLVVPNSALLAGNILILGKRDGEPLQARMSVNFCVDFKHAPQRVVPIVEDALAAAPIPNVAARPKPSCVCMEAHARGLRRLRGSLPPDGPRRRRPHELRRARAHLRRAQSRRHSPSAPTGPFHRRDQRRRRTRATRRFREGPQRPRRSARPDRALSVARRRSASPFRSASSMPTSWPARS